MNEKANLNIHISLPTYLFNSTMFKDDCRERNHIVQAMIFLVILRVVQYSIDKIH